ncbi:MAG TPA: glycosyltransferase [Pyrinomonadaceae bacterium]|nr:glycosyltransferase [Pyrinomonadaceae bacterium]
MPRILVLTLSFGSGHLRASHAIAKELKRIAPRADIRVVDALAECRLLFRACYEWPYWFMLRYAPGLWDRLNSARLENKHERTAPQWAFRLGCPKVFEGIKIFRPDVIVAGEVAACEMAVIARRLGITQAPIVNVITDYEAEPIWVKPEVDAYFVPDENVRAEMIRWGAIVDRIAISGIPVDPAFDPIPNMRTAQVNSELPIVLLMGGGMGPTRMDEVALQLGESKVPMHIVAVTGHDKRARRKLESLRVQSPVTMQVLGWTDDVASLMQAASILVTKPGGLTIAEAALGALPTILFDPIPGAEFVNAKRMVDGGAAMISKGTSETASMVVELLSNEASRRAMSLRANKLARPNARKEIAQLVLDLATPAKEMPRRMTA